MPMTSSTSLKTAWMRAVKDLVDHPPTQDFLFWLGGISFKDEAKNRISFSVKNNFIYKTILNKKYNDLIQKKLEDITNTPVICEWIIAEGENEKNKTPDVENSLNTSLKQQTDDSKDKIPEKDYTINVKTINSQKIIHHKSIPINPTLNNKYTFESFIVGENNRFAYNTAISITNRPGEEQNPCLIYGPVGLGKTHLMQSIGQSLYKKNPKYKVIYLTAETFLNEFQEALKTQEQYKFKNKYRYVDVLLIDDIHDLQNKEATQEELFHTFEALYNSGKQMIFTCDKPPKELRNFTERLKSRFERGVVVSISQPGWETRFEILKQNYKNYQTLVPAYLSESILKFIAKNINSNIRVLESALKTLANYNYSMNVEITPELAHSLLENFIDKRKKKDRKDISLEKILEITSTYYEIEEEDIISPSRSHDIMIARKVFIYLARNMTNYSTPQIGNFLERHHTSILNAEKSIKKELKNDTILSSQVKELTNRIEGKIT